MDKAVEEGSRGEDHGAGADAVSVQGLDPGDPPLSDEDFGDDGLEEGQPGLSLQPFFHGQPVTGLVGLGSRSLDRPSPAAVEEAEVDPGFVGQATHQAADGVDLPDELSFGQAADGGIAGHLGDGFQVGGDQACALPHGAGCIGGLAPGVSGAHHDDVIVESLGRL